MVHTLIGPTPIDVLQIKLAWFVEIILNKVVYATLYFTKKVFLIYTFQTKLWNIYVELNIKVKCFEIDSNTKQDNL